MIIVLVGSIGSGKTTACDYLVSSLGFEETSFAEPIKKFAVALGFSHKDVYGTQEEKLTINPYWGISGRVFMQRFGTDIMRKNSSVLGQGIDNVWIKAVECKMMRAKESKINLVVSDGRFDDEIDAVRRYGGVVIKLSRTNQEYSSIHESEKNIESISSDYHYANTGTKEDLYAFLEEVVKLN
jgi:hypothetical protein